MIFMRMLLMMFVPLLTVGFHGSTFLRRSFPSSRLQMAAKAFLDERTLWRMNLTFKRQGCRETTAAIRVRMLEARGYEPPQGRIFIEDDFNGLVKTDEKGYSGTWTLSEDKDDRKDGLWIWGLFEEPKYPYLYFYLDVYDDIVLPSGEKQPIYDDGETIPKGRLNMRFSHVQEKGKGAILTDGQMTYQETELLKADPLGIGGRVNVGNFIDAGQIEMIPSSTVDTLK